MKNKFLILLFILLASGKSWCAQGATSAVTIDSTSHKVLNPAIIFDTGNSFTLTSGATYSVPTWNQNTTGTAANVTGTVAVGNGGTGATTLTGILKGNGTSPFTTASAGTDYPGLASNNTWTGTNTYSNSQIVNGGITSSSGSALNITAPSTQNITLTTSGGFHTVIQTDTNTNWPLEIGGTNTTIAMLFSQSGAAKGEIGWFQNGGIPFFYMYDRVNGQYLWQDTPVASGTSTFAVTGSLTTTKNITTSGNISFSTSSDGITGTTTNDSAGTGIVGEFLQTLVASGSAVTLSDSTTATVLSKSVAAGDYSVSANINYFLIGATATAFRAGISTTAATVTLDGTEVYLPGTLSLTTGNYTSTTPTVRVSLASAGTIFVSSRVAFSAGSVSAFGSLNIRRVR